MPIKFYGWFIGCLDAGGGNHLNRVCGGMLVVMVCPVLVIKPKNANVTTGVRQHVDSWKAEKVQQSFEDVPLETGG